MGTIMGIMVVLMIIGFAVSGHRHMGMRSMERHPDAAGREEAGTDRVEKYPGSGNKDLTAPLSDSSTPR